MIRTRVQGFESDCIYRAYKSAATGKQPRCGTFIKRQQALVQHVTGPTKRQAGTQGFVYQRREYLLASTNSKFEPSSSATAFKTEPVEVKTGVINGPAAAPAASASASAAVRFAESQYGRNHHHPRRPHWELDTTERLANLGDLVEEINSRIPYMLQSMSQSLPVSSKQKLTTDVVLRLFPDSRRFYETVDENKNESKEKSGKRKRQLHLKITIPGFNYNPVAYLAGLFKKGAGGDGGGSGGGNSWYSFFSGATFHGGSRFPKLWREQYEDEVRKRVYLSVPIPPMIKGRVAYSTAIKGLQVVATALYVSPKTKIHVTGSHFEGPNGEILGVGSHQVGGGKGPLDLGTGQQRAVVPKKYVVKWRTCSEEYCNDLETCSSSSSSSSSSSLGSKSDMVNFKVGEKELKLEKANDTELVLAGPGGGVCVGKVSGVSLASTGSICCNEEEEEGQVTKYTSIDAMAAGPGPGPRPRPEAWQGQEQKQKQNLQTREQQRRQISRFRPRSGSNGGSLSGGGGGSSSGGAYLVGIFEFEFNYECSQIAIHTIQDVEHVKTPEVQAEPGEGDLAAFNF